METGINLAHVAWALSLDACVLLLMLVVKSLLLAGIVILVSRNEAHRTRKIFVYTVLLLGTTYAVFNPSNEPLQLIRAFLAMALLGTVVITKFCWIDIEKAFLAALLYSALSVAVSMYTTYGLDLLIDQRPTIGRTLAGMIDAKTRQTPEDRSLPPSPGVVAAVINAAMMTPEEGQDEGILQTLFTPLRAGQQAKKKIAEIDKIAAKQAAIVDSLSGVNTNRKDSLDELTAMETSLGENTGTPPTQVVAAPDPGPAPQDPRTPQAPGAPNPAPRQSAPVAPTKVLHDVLSKGLGLLPVTEDAPVTPDAVPDGSGGSVDVEERAVAVAWVGTNSPAATSSVPSTITGTNIWDTLTPEEQEQWIAARDAIVVSATGRSRKGAYALVGGQLVREGALYWSVWGGRSYAFRLRHVPRTGTCDWEPVFDPPKDETGSLMAF